MPVDGAFRRGAVVDPALVGDEVERVARVDRPREQHPRVAEVGHRVVRDVDHGLAEDHVEREQVVDHLALEAEAARELARGRNVLDLCCNTGGFAVYAKALGSADEVAAAAAFLCSADAAYITGCDLLIDGGWVGAIRGGGTPCGGSGKGWSDGMRSWLPSMVTVIPP